MYVSNFTILLSRKRELYNLKKCRKYVFKKKVSKYPDAENFVRTSMYRRKLGESWKMSSNISST
jgi:hypothetical protein